MAKTATVQTIKGEAETPLNDLLKRPLTPHTAFDVLLNSTQHDQLARTAKTFSQATLIPPHWRGKAADIFTVLCRAYTLNADPMMMLEQCFIVSGKVGMSAQLAIALANNSGKLKGNIDWDIVGEGKALQVTAYAELANGKRVSVTVDMKLAEDEKWTKNDKYRTMPEHMLCWRSATWLIRRYLPEVLLGMSTADELHDVQASLQKPDATPVEDDPPSVEEKPPPAEDDPPSVEEKPPPAEDEPEKITAAQVKRLHTMCTVLNVSDVVLKRRFKLASFNDIKTTQHDEVEKRILGIGSKDVLQCIEEAETVDQLEAACQDTIGWYEEGTATRRAYADKMAELAAKAPS